jgi:type II secretory pathway pseudopilin PulG
MFWRKITGHSKRGRVNSYALSGFTFLEIVISLLVLSVGALSMLQTINVAMNANYRAEQEVIVSNLASALLSEIRSKNFEDPTAGAGLPNIGPEGESRSVPPAFNDVDDYDSDGTPIPGGIFDSPPQTTDGFDMNPAGATSSGRPLPNWQGFTRSVNVEHVECTGIPVVCAPPPVYGWRDTKHIVVTVTGPSGASAVAEAIVK